VRIKGKKALLQEVIWDKRKITVEIYPQEPFQERRLSWYFKMKNPAYGGT